MSLTVDLASSDAATLRALFDAALAAALPDGRFDGRLPEPPKGRTLVLGAGKGAARMAQAFEAAWTGASHPLPDGLVVTRYGHGAPTRSIEGVEASHPGPDAAGLEAASRILALAGTAGPDDLVVFLMPGGVSALLALPAPSVTLADKQRLNRATCERRADRRHEPRPQVAIGDQGRPVGQCGRCGAAGHLSDLRVPGDDPGAIGSGPTNADGFLVVGRYTSHMSGIVSGMADHNAPGLFSLVFAGLAAFGDFLCGAACSAILINRGRRHLVNTQYILPITLESGLLLLIGAFRIWSGNHTDRRRRRGACRWRSTPAR